MKTLMALGLLVGAAAFAEVVVDTKSGTVTGNRYQGYSGIIQGIDGDAAKQLYDLLLEKNKAVVTGPCSKVKARELTCQEHTAEKVKSYQCAWTFGADGEVTSQDIACVLVEP